MSKNEPDVVDGEFTKWFWKAVAAADNAARLKASELPACAKCGGPMWCGQPAAHYSCLGVIQGVQKERGA